MIVLVFFFKQKTAYEMRISDWSSDVCSSDLGPRSDRRVVIADAGVDILAVERDAQPVRNIPAEIEAEILCDLLVLERVRGGVDLRRALLRDAAFPPVAAIEEGLAILVDAQPQIGVAFADIGTRRRPPAPEEIAVVVEIGRAEEHTSELQSLMRISYAVFCFEKKTHQQKTY